MQVEQFQVPEGYALVRIQKKETRTLPKVITRRGPKVFPPNIRMAIEIAANIVKRIQAKKEVR